MRKLEFRLLEDGVETHSVKIAELDPHKVSLIVIKSDDVDEATIAYVKATIAGHLGRPPIVFGIGAKDAFEVYEED